MWGIRAGKGLQIPQIGNPQEKMRLTSCTLREIQPVRVKKS